MRILINRHYCYCERDNQGESLLGRNPVIIIKARVIITDNKIGHADYIRKRRFSIIFVQTNPHPMSKRISKINFSLSCKILKFIYTIFKFII